MAADVRITFASNRGPVSFVEDDDGGFDTKRGAGGLAGAMHPVARRLGDDALWIAAATTDTDRRAIAAGATDRLRSELGYGVSLLDIDPRTYSDYYDEISNRLLWFANHCLWDEVGIEPAAASMKQWDDAYVPVNKRFAEAVAELGHPEALVFFQDYHLSLAPALLRSMDPSRTSLHFTHSSFCRFDGGLGHLPDPVPGAIVDGMLGADLVGFHEPRWANNFLDCCDRLGYRTDRAKGFVEVDDRVAWVRCYPIPIDPDDLKRRAEAPETRAWARRHLEWAAGRALIARVDRMEPSKNIVRGFEAFRALLHADPSLKDRVCFVACVYPSRQNVAEYRDYARRIEEVVGRIEAEHPGTIRLFTEDDFDRSLGALISYDVLLVNSIMDGMNLVSKEGPTLNERDGALILSTGAGSFGELGADSVVIEDPLDVAHTAARIAEALAMPVAQRGETAARLRAAVASRVPGDWLQEQIDDLTAIRRRGHPLSSFEEPGE